MEPHTDEKGGLRGKFEDYSYTPKEEVWDRIAAGPGERPLGALFASFAWIPNARVWKRISAELHPVPVLRIASWSAAAAAAVALLVWLQFGGAGAGENAGNGRAAADGAEGKSLAAMDLQDCWSERTTSGDAQGSSISDLADHNSKFHDHAGHPPMAVKGAHSPKNQDYNRSPKKDGPLAEVEIIPGKVHVILERAPQNWPNELQPRSLAVLNLPVALQDINRRTTQIVALDVERELMAQADFEAAQQAWEARHAQAEPAPLVAQAGASLSGAGAGPGNLDAFSSLSDYADPLSNVGVAEQMSSRVSNETFHTPVVVGAAVDHGLWKGLGLGGGLVYTHMRSYQEGSLTDVAQRLEVTRQYLGLATNLRYDLPLTKGSDRVAVFGTTGLQYDFGLAKHTSLTTTRASAFLLDESADSKLGGQASVNAGMGLRYTLYKNIGLYAQAAAAHYFAAAEANLYTSRLFWPTMQVGLRVRL